jgi:hypothetical protein
MMNMNNFKQRAGDKSMPSSRVAALTKEDIAAAARSFHWRRRMPKWSVIVEGREFPARPLILGAAGVPPNDPTNSHQAVAILKERGFEVRYKGKTLEDEENAAAGSGEPGELITKLRGSCKSDESLVELREREHKDERY